MAQPTEATRTAIGMLLALSRDDLEAHNLLADAAELSDPAQGAKVATEMMHFAKVFAEGCAEATGRTVGDVLDSLGGDIPADMVDTYSDVCDLIEALAEGDASEAQAVVNEYDGTPKAANLYKALLNVTVALAECEAEQDDLTAADVLEAMALQLAKELEP